MIDDEISNAYHASYPFFDVQRVLTIVGSRAITMKLKINDWRPTSKKGDEGLTTLAHCVNWNGQKRTNGRAAATPPPH